MKLLLETIQYQEVLSVWAGCKTGLYDDFDMFCDSDFDFIEILMLFEKEFLVNLLDTEKVRQDFKKVHEFISWAVSQPNLEESYTFSFSYEPKSLLSSNPLTMKKVCRMQSAV